MSLINCGNNKHKCGNIVSSSCVSFEGQYDNLLNKKTLPCNANLDDVIKILSENIDKIKNSVDITKLDTKCLNFDTKNNSVIELQQVLINQVCVLQNILTTLKLTVDNLNASNIFATLDLGCLKTNAASCNVGGNTYSILSLLNLFKNEICLLKNP